MIGPIPTNINFGDVIGQPASSLFADQPGQKQRHLRQQALRDQQIAATQGIQIDVPDTHGAIRGLMEDINMTAGYSPLQAMNDGIQGKEPPLRIQVSRSDNKLVKRIYLRNRRKMSSEMFTFWEQEFVRLCKEDDLI